MVKANQGILYKLVGLYAADQEEKKDLYQEILLQAWRAWPAFRGEAKFSTWLYRISLNTILTQKRKPQRVDYKESLDLYSPKVAPVSERQMEVDRLRQAIRSLAETDRAIISLHLDGYDNGEIAAMIGITNNNVGVKLHRIKQQLADRLNQGL